MEIHLTGTNLAVTHSIRDYVREKFGRALARVAHRILAVRVRISDINGPRGGIDKRCHVEVVPIRSQRVVLEEVADDLYCAIDRVAHRIKAVTFRRLARKS